MESVPGAAPTYTHTALPTSRLWKSVWSEDSHGGVSRELLALHPQPDRKMGADGHNSENKLVAESTQLLIAWKTEVPKKAGEYKQGWLSKLGAHSILGA
ncbi:hypothetical protein CapIbe_005253 [Capra ibex]